MPTGIRHTETTSIRSRSAPERITVTDAVAASGPAGGAGADGAPGQGVPPAGTVGQYLRKNGVANYDSVWDTIDIADVQGLVAALAAKADQTAIDDHLSDAADAHDASAISTNVSAFNLNLSAADDTVQKALDTLDNLVASGSAGLDDHLNDASDAHDASAISYAGGTGMSATDVEAAIDELANEKANVASAVMDGDAAGGVLGGTYPSPSFAVDMATQAELDAVVAASVLDGDTAGGVLAGTYPSPSFAVDMATQAELDAHVTDATAAHAASAVSYTGGTGMSATDVEAAIDELANEKANVADSVLDGDAAGGVLSGTYPSPGFAVDMATQAELNSAVAAAVNDGDAAGGVLGGTYPNPSFAADMATQAELDAHVSDSSDAHDASAVSYVPGTGMSAVDVQAGLDELATEKANVASAVMDGDAAGGALAGTYPSPSFAVDMATQAELDAHVGDTSDAHDSSAISYVPGTGMSATDAQAALDELATEKANLASAVMDGDAAGGALGGTYPNPSFAVDMATQAELDAHVGDTSDAHDASAISYVPGTGMSATDAQSALDELATEKANAASSVMDGDAAGGVLAGTYPNPSFAADMATQAELDAHVNDATDAHDSSAISYPGGTSLPDTEVQSALDRLGIRTASLHDVVVTTHSWDYADAVLYQGTSLWGESPGDRILSVPDRGTDGTFPFVRDPGLWAGISETSPPDDLPGPLFFPNSPKFNGRPCGYNDNWGWISDGLFAPRELAAGLTTSEPTPGTYFNDPDGYDQPYWFMVLGRIPTDGSHPVRVLIDSLGGGLTVAEDDTALGKWGITTDFADLWPNSTHDFSDEETVLIFVAVNGASTFFEINWRDADGVVQTTRETLALDTRVGDPGNRLVYTGLLSSGILSALKLDLGSPTEDELDALRAWADPWMPSSGPLANYEPPTALGTSFNSTGLAVITTDDVQAALEEVDAAVDDVTTSLADYLPLAGGNMSGSLRFLDGITMLQRVSSTDRFALGATTIFGAFFSAINDITNGRNVVLFKAGAAGLASSAFADTITVGLGAGQTAELVGLYSGITKLWSVEADFSVLFADQTDRTAPGSGTKLWTSSTGLKSRRATGGVRPIPTMTNTDGSAGVSIYVGAVDPSGSYTPATGDVWVQL